MSEPICPNCEVPRYPAYGACYACGKPFAVEVKDDAHHCGYGICFEPETCPVKAASRSKGSVKP